VGRVGGWRRIDIGQDLFQSQPWQIAAVVRKKRIRNPKTARPLSSAPTHTLATLRFAQRRKV